MVRTQVYLTKSQRDELKAIAKAAGKKQSELIREAIDRLIDEVSCTRREIVLRETAGICAALPRKGAGSRSSDRLLEACDSKE